MKRIAGRHARLRRSILPRRRSSEASWSGQDCETAARLARGERASRGLVNDEWHAAADRIDAWVGKCLIMTSVHISEPRLSVDRGRAVVAAEIAIGRLRHEVWFRASQGPLAAGVEPFLVASLFPAMC